MTNRDLEGMRQILRSSMRRSLNALSEGDRLAAAWTLACGRTMAERGEIIGFHAGTLHIIVAEPEWLTHMSSMRRLLEHELSQLSGVPVAAIHFELKKSKRRRYPATDHLDF